MKLNYCAVLTVISGLLLLWMVIALFLPLVAVIQNLSGDTKPTGQIDMPAMARVMLHPVSGILMVAFAIAVLGVSIRGAKRETTKRGWWILLAVVNAIALLAVCMEAFALPKFMGLFKDWGIK